MATSQAISVQEPFFCNAVCMFMKALRIVDHIVTLSEKRLPYGSISLIGSFMYFYCQFVVFLPRHQLGVGGHLRIAI